MTMPKSVLLALGLALLGGCSSVKVNYDYDKSANWASFKTFDWYAATPKDRGKAGGVENPLMDRRVRGAVERQLTAKGFRLERAGEPDFLVTYYPTYQHHAVVTQSGIHTGMGWGYRPFGFGIGTGVSEVREYREGSIVLEIADAKTKSVVFQAVGEGALTGLEDPRDADEQVEDAVQKILSHLPTGIGVKIR